MTNYEWLIKTGKLEAFIWDLLDTTTTIQSLNAQYGWELKSDRYNNRRIAEWLQAEHKELTKWVRFDDVMKIFYSNGVCDNGIVDEYLQLHGKEKPTQYLIDEVIRKALEYREDMLLELETKEIEDKRLENRMKENKTRKLYEIENVGCDDTTHSQLELTDEEAEALIRFAKLNNCNSDSGCQPRIYITCNGEDIV